MKKFFQKLTGSYSATAKVVDGTLVLSAPDATSPVVWRMDMGFVRASALEVRDTKDGQFMLTLKTPKEDIHDVAAFNSKAKALGALMAVSDAMENAGGQIRPGPAAVSDHNGTTVVAAPPRKKGRLGKIIAVIIGVFLLFLFLSAIVNYTPQAVNMPSENGASDNMSSSSPAGVPLSADDFLQNR